MKRISMSVRSARGSVLAATMAVTVGVTSCSLVGGEEETGNDRVVLLTHSSFALPDELIADFESESGLDLEIRPVGDGGTLTNELVLTKDQPLGDVAFGVDNTFASRALEEDVFAPADIDYPAGVDGFTVPGDDEGVLTPVDNGNVCVNVDETWFAERDLAPPETLDDLVDPAYEGLFVTPAATTSTPGLAFLLATIAEYGDGWPDYWTDLVANGARITKGWEDAYQVDFTQGGGEGDRPIVLSYDSSPAFTVSDDGESTTRALLETCFEQVEYVGLIDGADNTEGGRELIEFMLSEGVQEALPESMFVFPVVDGVELPAEWAQHADRPTEPYVVPAADIDDNRDAWLREWSDVTTR